MVCPALHRDQQPLDARYRFDDANVDLLIVEDAPLLNMQFNERLKIVTSRLVVTLWREARCPHGFSDTHTVVITQRIQLPSLDQPQYAPRSPVVRREAAALLLAQGDHLQRSLRLPHLLAQSLQRDQRRKDAQRTIKLPTQFHSIDV